MFFFYYYSCDCVAVRTFYGGIIMYLQVVNINYCLFRYMMLKRLILKIMTLAPKYLFST